MTDARDLELPPAMVQRALEFQGPPAPVRPAATVVLLRPVGPAETRPRVIAGQIALATRDAAGRQEAATMDAAAGPGEAATQAAAAGPGEAATQAAATGLGDAATQDAAAGRERAAGQRTAATQEAAAGPEAAGREAAAGLDAGRETAAGRGAAAGLDAGGIEGGREAAAGRETGAGRETAAPGGGTERSFEVYVIRRASTMAFGGVYAFPGGGVDPADRPETLRQDWPELLGVPDERARAVVGAAARELFEETGVLLAGRAHEPDHTVSYVTGDDWEADRAMVAGRQLTMADLLKRRGLRLRDDLLLPWARWITPEFEPRRYDTWFFVALLPEAQTARDVSGEADRTTWISPAAADGLALLPPTRAMLNDLCAYRRIEDVVAGSRHRNAAAAVMPRAEPAGDGGVILHVPRAPTR